MVSRRKASVRNAFTAMMAQTVKLFGQFVVQTVFVRVLGTEYLGANGLFTNLITFLSFAELGIGFAFSYALYRPLAEGNKREISVVMSLYRRVYNTIGIVILVLGLVVSLFVPSLVNSNSNVAHIQIYFILFLLSSVVSYFFTYNRSLLIADQLGYIDSINQLIFSLVKFVVQFFLILTFHSYVGYLVTQILTNLVSNIAITRLANKRYPFLDEHIQELPERNVVSKLKRNVIGTISSKVGSVVVNGTDNILISKYVGLSVVGLYSNYSLIVAGITAVLSQALNSVIASFGNLGVMEKKNIDKQIRMFNQFVFFNAFSTFFISLVLFAVFQPFIGIWLGEHYRLSELTLMLIIVNFALAQFRPALYLINAYGLFWGYRIKSIVEAVVNFGLSFALVKYTGLGINGVLAGTIVGNILVNSWWDPLILFSGAFHRGISKFYLKYWLYLATFMSLLAVEYKFTAAYSPSGLVAFLGFAVLISVVILSVLLCAFAFTDGERDVLRRVFRKMTG